MMLCDHAAVAEGKLFVSGGGWGLIGPAPSPSAIAILIEVPWDQTNRKVVFSLSLHSADGAGDRKNLCDPFCLTME
jgi:hypothetical protein